jgi:hypothetical protein
MSLVSKAAIDWLYEVAVAGPTPSHIGDPRLVAELTRSDSALLARTDVAGVIDPLQSGLYLTATALGYHRIEVVIASCLANAGMDPERAERLRLRLAAVRTGKVLHGAARLGQGRAQPRSGSRRASTLHAAQT